MSFYLNQFSAPKIKYIINECKQFRELITVNDYKSGINHCNRLRKILICVMG